MTPEKRLNQIEPVIAEVAQKVDRLIEGIGQIIVEVSKIEGIEQELAKIANIEQEVAKIVGIEYKVAGIEKEVAKIAGIEKEVAKIAGIEKEVAKIAGIEKEVAKIAGIERTGAITAKGLADLTIRVGDQFDFVTMRFDQQQYQINDLRQEMNQKFDQILTLLQEKLP